MVSVEGFQQIAVENEEQNKGQGDGTKTGKLHGKALPASAFFTKGHRCTQADTADQRGGSHDDRYDPAHQAQKTVVIGAGNDADHQIHIGKTDIKQQQQNIGDASCFVQLVVYDAVLFSGAQGKEKTGTKGVTGGLAGGRGRL